MFRNLSNSLAYRWQLFTPIGFVRALRAALPRIDIGHLHACRNLPVAAAARLLAAARIPYVVSPHGTAPNIERRHAAKRIFDATAGRGYLEGAARVVAVSDAERRQLVGSGCRTSESRSFRTQSTNANSSRRPMATVSGRARLGDAPIVLHLSKLTPRKGADTLIRAFDGSIAPTLRSSSPAATWIRGWTPQRSAPTARLAHRHADRPRSSRCARGGQVVVYPSKDEVFGLVPLEALLAGTPVIVCGDSGAGEIIGTMGGGHIVPPATTRRWPEPSPRSSLPTGSGASALGRQRRASGSASAATRCVTASTRSTETSSPTATPGADGPHDRSAPRSDRRHAGLQRPALAFCRS